jgi:hypothetical protein
MAGHQRSAALGVAVGVVAGVLGIGAGVTHAVRAPVVLGVGDTIQVRGQPVGCMVRRFQGRTVVDCRRAGTLAGTYGTFFDGAKVVVVRFESAQAGKAVFKAEHGQRRFTVCRD